MRPAIHIGEIIQQQLETQGRSVKWLAGKINCDRSNLCKHLKNPHIHTELLYRISVALDEDFLFTILRYYPRLGSIMGMGSICLILWRNLPRENLFVKCRPI